MIAAGGAGDAGDILRDSSGKTNAVVFSAVQPHRLGVLKAALNALVAEERILTAPWSLPRWYRPSKRLLRASASGDRASGSRPGVVTPATPPPASERPEGVPRMGQSASLCRCAIYSGSRSGPWVLEAAEPSEYLCPMHGSAYGLRGKPQPVEKVDVGPAGGPK
jgi:hypothetical protein